LARVRRLPAPPQSPRNRRLAEVEKERARSALRSRVADPATEFAAMDADEFFAVLRCACQEGLVNASLIAEVGRRMAAGEVTSRDLHQVLFGAGDGDRWRGVRGAAMAVVAGRLHLAVEVVNLEVQRVGGPPVRVVESAGDGGFTARASLDRGHLVTEGRPCFDTSKKRASQRAVVSLLAELAGVPVPAEIGSDGRPVPAPARTASLAGPATADVEAWLDYAVRRPEPDRLLAEQLVPEQLTARSIYLLLFEADPRGWARHRTDAWECLVGTPSRAPGILSMHIQARSLSPAPYVEPREGAALAYVVTPEGPVVGEPAFAAGPRAARTAAALALVRDFAPPVEEAGGPVQPMVGSNPVGLLNERAQVGVIADLTYEMEATGPAHRPVFTCTASCTHAAERLVSRVADASKNAAKAAAAAGLLQQLLTAERVHLARLVRARREQARSPEGVFGRLLRAGCRVDFVGAAFRIGGDLPEPLAGYELSVACALPVLATLDGQIHPSTRAWAAATRAALEAIAARRVYPALDADGRDRWRLALDGPGDPALAGFFDRVAEIMVRPAGARLVVGDFPYAGRARRLDPDAADWADRVADAAEGTTAASLVIRLSPPEREGLPLRAAVSVLSGAREGLLGPAEQRLLRRAGRQWPPLDRVLVDGTLGGAEATQLLGPAGERLAALGITVEWPADLVAASGLGKQVVASRRPPARPPFPSPARRN
jgi:hypothetical protein